MRKILLGILAISSFVFAGESKIASGDIAAKLTLGTTNFHGGSFGAELSGKANFVYDINVEGNIHLAQSFKGGMAYSFPEDVKIYNLQKLEGFQIVGNNSLGMLSLQNTYLKVDKGLGDFGRVALTQRNIHATNFAYLSPIYSIKNLDLSGKLGYTIDYTDPKSTVGHRGDLDAKVSYKLQEGLKLSAEAGIAVSNEKYDTLATRLTVSDNKVAIIPKVALGVDYKDGKGIQTGVKLSYQKEIPGLDVYFAYDVPSEKLASKDLSLKTIVQFSSSSDFLLPNNEKDVKEYFSNLSALTTGLDLGYKINDSLSFVSNITSKNSLHIEYRHTEKQEMEENNGMQTARNVTNKDTIFTIFSENSISLGLKYNF